MPRAGNSGGFPRSSRASRDRYCRHRCYAASTSAVGQFRVALLFFALPGIPSELAIDIGPLLDLLWAHATAPHFCYRHRWRVGQVMIFDNRRLLHMRHPMDERKTRFMWRTQTKGEVVRAAPALGDATM